MLVLLRRASALAPLVLLLLLMLSSSSRADDFGTIKSRVYADALLTARPSNTDATAWMNQLTPQGTWPDIDYKRQDRALWAPERHLSRLLQLCVAYRTPGADNPFFGSAPLRIALLSAYDGWFSVIPGSTPTSTNWWHNEIGVQLDLGPILMLMQSELSAQQLDEGVAILAIAWTPTDTSYKNQATNLAWRARISVWRACLTQDAALMTDLSQRIGAETAVVDAEGLQADGSFWQHGEQLYSMGYGRGFSADLSQLAAWFHDTAFAFSDEVIANLSKTILDGQQWMMRGPVPDDSARGREIVRIVKRDDTSLIVACARMIALGTPRAREFAIFKARMEQKPDAPPFEGNRYFWRSEFMAQQRASYYTSARMASTKLVGAEVANDEGLRSYYTGDGVNYLYRTGREYQQIFPVWDWCRLPGITAPHDVAPPPITSGWMRGTSPYTAGVSDGTYGVNAFDYSRDSVKARKSYFFFDEEYVCLGAGITSTGARPINTAVNQCLLQGPVTSNSGGALQTLPQGERALSGANGPLWVHQDEVGYVFPQADSVMLKNAPQSGRWSDIKGDADKNLVTKDVFSLWLDHGVKPDGAAYAYIVVPGVSAAQLEGYAAQLPVVILANRADVQAVYHPGLKVVQAAFYAPGLLSVPGGASLLGGLEIEVSRRCVLMLRQIAPGKLQLSIADTDNVKTPQASITVDIAHALRGQDVTQLPNGKSRVTFSLPTGMLTGQTVTKNLTLGL